MFHLPNAVVGTIDLSCVTDDSMTGLIIVTSKPTHRCRLVVLPLEKEDNHLRRGHKLRES